MKLKNNEISKMLQDIRIDEDAVIGEINKVVVEIHTKDGKKTRQTILGSEMKNRLSTLGVVSNCIGFPAAKDADFAALRSALTNPTKLLRDFLNGDLAKFFDSRYRIAFWEIRGKRQCLVLRGSYNFKERVYYIGKRKSKFQLDLNICDYLSRKKTKKEKSYAFSDKTQIVWERKL